MSFQCPWPGVEISRTNDGRAWAYSIRALLARNTRFLNNFRKWPRDHASIMDIGIFFFFLDGLSLPLQLHLSGLLLLFLPFCRSTVSRPLFVPTDETEKKRGEKNGKKKQKKITFAATRDTRSKKCNSVSHATTSRKSISDGIMWRARPCK